MLPGLVACTVLLLAAAPASGQTDPVDDAEAQLAAARAEADQAAGSYLELLTRSETLDAEMAATELRLAELEAQADELRAAVRDRAATAYVRAGDNSSIEFGLRSSDEEALEGARRRALLNRLNANDNALAEELAKVTDSVEARREQLRADRAAYEETLALLREEQAQVDAKLAKAQAARDAALAQAAAQAAAATPAPSAPGPAPESAPAPAPTGGTTPAPPSAPTPPTNYTPTPGEHPQHWDPFLVCTRQIESGGNYQAYNASGPYYGAYQFLQSTWNSTANHAGRYELIGLDPRNASEYDQDDMAWVLYQWKGKGPWGGRC